VVRERAEGVPSYEKIARREARKDRHLAAWLGYMGVGEDTGRPHSIQKTLLTRWEREELARVNARRYNTWLVKKREVEKRGGWYAEPFVALTYLPDGAYEAAKLMRYVT
jgi:hypothetical protein